MKDRFERLAVILVLLVPLLFAFRGGYLQQVTGYVYLYLIQGYVAWFLYFKSGQPFFAYSVTMAIGAYGTIVITTIFGAPLLLSMIAGALGASLLAVFIFLVTSRARGFYVSMASFLLAILFPRLIEALRDITGGRSGIYFTGLVGSVGDQALYAIVITVTVGIVAFFFWLMRTKAGRILVLISENDLLTQAVGINTFAYKTLAYAIAGLISGIGGGLYVNYTGFVSSVDIEVFTTLNIFFIPLIGGSRVFYGPIVGALFVILAPELFGSVERYLRIFMGLLFILVIVLLPEGIAPGIERRIAQLWPKPAGLSVDTSDSPTAGKG